MAFSAPVCLVGPSPRVRGAARQRVRWWCGRGSIPARAGSRAPRPARRHRPRVHPRACGEQGSRSPGASSPRGPSPRVRGAAGVCGGGLPAAGSIPARAGSRPRRSTPVSSWRVHPRSCGEQSISTACRTRGRGPSPRVRGAAADSSAPPGGGGSIPARAGSRRGRAHRGRGRWVHPRACGEQEHLVDRCSLRQGPSPRVRGAADQRPGGLLGLGSIPARAGSRCGCAGTP